MANAIRMGFIGGGHITQEVHLPVLSRMPEVEPLVLCDVLEAALDGAYRKFGLRETTTAYQDVLDMQEVDAVLIAVPNYLHARIAVEALRAGKHVLCEKPAGLTVEEARAVQAAAEASGMVYMMSLPHRFDAQCVQLKRWIAAGHLGHIYHARAGLIRRDACPGGWFTDRERSGGGAFVQYGTHLLDLILWCLDFAPVRRLSAASYDRLASHRGSGPARSLASPRPLDGVYDVEDSSIIFMRMSEGRTAVIETAWSLHCGQDRDYLDLYGDRAGACLWPLRLFQEMDGTPVDVTPRLDSSQNYQHLARHFVSCVLAHDRGERITPIGNADDGVRLAHLTRFIYQSAREEREVEVTEQPAALPR